MRQAHWVRRNERSRVPRRHLVLDTEAVVATAGDHTQLQAYRCSVLARLDRSPTGYTLVDVREHTDVRALWDDVTSATRAAERTVLWAHHLAYDLRIAQALTELPARGWTLEACHLGTRTAWLRWRRGRRSLVMVDSTSVWPCRLEELARDLGTAKLPLPRPGDGTERWLARCRRDVEVLAEALRRYLDWLVAEDLGSWQLSGAGQAWAAWRHRWLTHRVLVHADPEALAAERRAMWAGRAEAYRIGRAPRAEVVEADLERCYLRLARDLELPAQLLGPPRPCDLRAYERWRERWACLVEAVVETPVPILPAEGPHGICWPVGRIRGVWWDVEIDAALQRGASVQFVRVWRYRRAPILRDWATWVEERLSRPCSALDPVIRRALKHWSRALIGRLSLRYRAWEPYARSGRDHLQHGLWADLEDGAQGELLWVGSSVLLARELIEGRDSLPQVTGYIMAAARVRLAGIIEAIGEDEILHVDTDGLLLTARGWRRVLERKEDPRLAGLRRKRAWRGYDIRGTRAYRVGRETRIAGIPRRASWARDGTIRGEVWEGLLGAIQRGRPGVVLVQPRSWRLHGQEHRRLVLEDGRTRPLTLP